jgi:large subunit ribosomal protein L4
MAESKKAPAPKGATTKAAPKAPAKSVVKETKKAAKPVKAAAAKKAAPKAEKPKAEKKVRKAEGSVSVSGGQVVSDAKLAPSVFELKPNDHLLYEAVKLYRAGSRSGTHKTKNRGAVSGSGKKPWKQKGTGQARVGEKRTPLWRHGGTVFGPTPRDYSYTMPKKAMKAALRQALSTKNRTGALRIVESLRIESPKTKALKAAVDALNFDGKTLYVESEPSDALILSSRNIPGFRVIAPTHLTVYDILNCKTLAVSKAALSHLEERLAQ